MASLKRIKTNYPGVFYIDGKSHSNGKTERIYYIRYRKNGNLIEEKAGRQYLDDMTPARASILRGEKIKGSKPSRNEKRELDKAEKSEESSVWTINRLWEEYKLSRRDNKGLYCDENRYNNYLKAEFGNKLPKDIQPLEIDRLKNRLLKRLSEQTVLHILNLLTWIVNFGVKRNLCSKLQFTIDKPKPDNQKTEDLTLKQQKQLLKAIENDKNETARKVMKIAFLTGMRRSEILKLKWNDIYFEREYILLCDPKGKKDKEIPLNAHVQSIIRDIERTESEYIFPGQNPNKPIVNIYPALRRIRRKAGIEDNFRPLHGLRHVFASNLASSGKVEIYTIQKLLTHTDSRMTQRYAHLRDEALKKASEVATEIFKNLSDAEE